MLEDAAKGMILLLSMMTLKMLLVALIELQNDCEMVYYVVVCLQYIWVQVSDGFFKKAKYPQNEVWDGEIIENEGGLYLGV
jgi:hypothetical protein